MKRTLLVLVLWSGFAIATSAYASSSQHEKLVTEVITLSGADAIFNSVQFSAQASEETIPPNSIEQKIIDVMNEPLDVEVGKKIMTGFILENCTDNNLKILLSWYKSPLWKKIKVEKANAPMDPLDISRLQYLYELKTSPPTKERMELIRNFVIADKLVELSVGIINRIQLILLEITARCEESSLANNYKIDDNFRDNTIKDVEFARKQYFIKSLFDYRTISNGEMKQYIRFVSTKEYMNFEIVLYNSVQTWLNVTLVKKLVEKTKECVPHNDAGL